MSGRIAAVATRIPSAGGAQVESVRVKRYFKGKLPDYANEGDVESFRQDEVGPEEDDDIDNDLRAEVDVGSSTVSDGRGSAGRSRSNRITEDLENRSHGQRSRSGVKSETYSGEGEGDSDRNVDEGAVDWDELEAISDDDFDDSEAAVIVRRRRNDDDADADDDNRRKSSRIAHQDSDDDDKVDVDETNDNVDHHDDDDDDDETAVERRHERARKARLNQNEDEELLERWDGDDDDDDDNDKNNNNNKNDEDGGDNVGDKKHSSKDLISKKGRNNEHSGIQNSDSDSNSHSESGSEYSDSDSQYSDSNSEYSDSDSDSDSEGNSLKRNHHHHHHHSSASGGVGGRKSKMNLMFIPKSVRDAISKADEDMKSLLNSSEDYSGDNSNHNQDEYEKKKQQRAEEAKQLLEETLQREANLRAEAKREEERKSLGLRGTDSVDDSDNPNDEEEYQLWRVRELKRIKRDREERERIEQEKLETERRRNMTERERLEERAKNSSNDNSSADQRGKMRYLQKYYHKGVFFMDRDERGEFRESIFNRDMTAPTLEDRFDKQNMPKVMQVKNFGRAGATKYTHLLDQDTTIVKTSSSKLPGQDSSFPAPSVLSYRPGLEGSGGVSNSNSSSTNPSGPFKGFRKYDSLVPLPDAQGGFRGDSGGGARGAVKRMKYRLAGTGDVYERPRGRKHYDNE